MNMEKKEMRIVFMGTTGFAAFSLERLVTDGFNVVGVVTTTDKPQGRHGSVLVASPVKLKAQELGLTVLQPDRLKDQCFLDALSALHADLQVVVAFRMLPEVVWKMPPLGTFNLHASLLPQLRGAAPINWAIIDGMSETGVTTFFLSSEIDTGDIIYKVSEPILDTDNFATLSDRLMRIGADLVVKTASDIADGCVETTSQGVVPDDNLKPAPKIFKETCRIDWNRSPRQVWNFVRGLSPSPAAWSTLCTPDGRAMDCKIFDVEMVEQETELAPGSIHTDGRSYIEVSVLGGSVRVKDLQVAGKKCMPAKAFLCGCRLSDSCFFR